jgi:hypothetical protein
MISVKSIQAELFDRLITEKRYERITYLSEGLGLEIAKELRTSMHGYIEKGNLSAGLEILERTPGRRWFYGSRGLRTLCHF